MTSRQRLIAFLILLATALVARYVVYPYLEKIQNPPFISEEARQGSVPSAFTIINADFCGNLFAKDASTLVFVGKRDSRYEIASSTTIDVSDVSLVKNVAGSPTTLPIKDWMSQQSPLAWATTESNTCAPGWVHITGSLDSSGVFRATDITEHAQ